MSGPNAAVGTVGVESLVETLRRRLQQRPLRWRGPRKQLEQLAWDIVLTALGVRTACLVDCFIASAASIEALQAVVSDCLSWSRRHLAIVHLKWAEQLFVVHRASASRALEAIADPAVQHESATGRVLWIDARRSKAVGTLRAGASKEVQTLAEDLLDKIRPAHAEDRETTEKLLYIEQDVVQGVDGGQIQPQRGVALSGILLGYPAVFTLEAWDEKDVEGSDSNNLFDQPLALFTLELANTDQDGDPQAIHVLSFSVPVAAFQSDSSEKQLEDMRTSLTSRTAENLEAAKVFSNKDMSKVEHRWRSWLANKRPQVTLTVVQLPVVAL